MTTPTTSRIASGSATASTGSRSSSTSPSASAEGATNSPRFRRPGTPEAGRGQRPVALVVGVLLAAALAAVVATRGDAAAPDETARLVPADALLYAHLSTDPGRMQDARLRAILSRFTSLRAQAPRLAMQFTPSAGGLDLDRDVRPWLGEEVAVALLDGGPGGAEPMLVATVRDRAAATAALERIGATRAGSHRGEALRSLPPRATAAFAGDHLVVGPAGAVRGAIDRAAGAGGAALADDRVYRRAADEREGASSADVFASGTGLRRLLDGRDGIAGVAGRLLAGPSLDGVTAQINAEAGGLRVTARVLRAPGGSPGPGFAPTALAGRAPEGVAAFLALPGLDAAAAALERAGGAALLEGLREAIPTEAGIELEDVIAPHDGEAALTIASGEAAPVFTLSARTRDAARTREALARLQGPLADRLAAGAPFTQRDVGGTTTFSLPVTDALEPSYGIRESTVVASTDPSGLAQLGAARAPVTGSAALAEVMPEEDAKVEALGFLDPRQLLALGERTGLRAIGSPAVRDDLSRIRAAGVVVEEDATHPDTTAELFLEIP